MKTISFTALQVTENDHAIFQRTLIEKPITALPEGDVLIKVHYSSLNYKDALSASGNKGVTRHYPHTPGIDAAGIVQSSDSDKFNPGDQVIVTGYDLGMNTSGGFGAYINVPAAWVLLCPNTLSLKESMAYGTAGFTAALSVHKLINSGVQPKDGDVLVTGATGGVATIAIALLDKLGYKVIAATGKAQAKEQLLSIGAKDLINRDEVDDASNRPMLKSRWAGVIDTVGGNTLATALKTTSYGGTVTCCGNIADDKFISSVYPFILRGISLLGVDSVQCPMSLREDLWSKLATTWKLDLSSVTTEVTLDGLEERIQLMLAGKHVGRTRIRLPH